MSLKTAWMIAAAMLMNGPVFAHPGDDEWEARYYEHRDEHKGKGRRKGRERDHDRGHYIIYVPLYPRAGAAVPSKPRQPSPPPAMSPRSFPKETPEQRARASDRQRTILERELVTEQELLELARRELAEQQAAIDANRGDRSVLGPYKDNVELHERNVAALRRELSQLGR